MSSPGFTAMTAILQYTVSYPEDASAKSDQPFEAVSNAESRNVTDLTHHSRTARSPPSIHARLVEIMTAPTFSLSKKLRQLYRRIVNQPPCRRSHLRPLELGSLETSERMEGNVFRLLSHISATQLADIDEDYEISTEDVEEMEVSGRQYRWNDLVFACRAEVVAGIRRPGARAGEDYIMRH